MEFFKRLFATMKEPIENMGKFSVLEHEALKMFASTGEVTIENNFIRIENYLFEPSIAFRQLEFYSTQIDDIDIKSYPPTLKIENELVFVSTEKKVELEKFALRNNIKLTERPTIWELILEPFIDTEFSQQTEEKIANRLESFGLTKESVNSLRAEIKTQMLKYNFDTTLWDWGGLGALDVLKAMRTKYNREEFAEFYKKVMAISLLTEKITKQQSPNR